MKPFLIGIFILSDIHLNSMLIYAICDSDNRDVIGCVIFGEKYSRSQWAICMDEGQLNEGSRAVSKCMKDKNCWFPCQMAAFGKEDGRVSDLCVCEGGQKKSDVDSSCYLYRFGDCTWYERCLKPKLEKVLKCEQNVSNYIVQIGSRLCRAHETLFLNTPAGKTERLLDFQKCLQAPLMSTLFQQNSIICHNLNYTFKSNSMKCFTSLAENWICDIPKHWFGLSRFKAYHTLKSAFLDVIGKEYDEKLYDSYWIWDYKNLPCDISTGNPLVKRLLISTNYTEDQQLAQTISNSVAKTLSWQRKCIGYDAKVYHRPSKNDITFIEMSLFPISRFDAYTTNCNTKPIIDNERNKVTDSLPCLEYVIQCTDGHEECVKGEGFTQKDSDRSCTAVGGYCTTDAAESCPGIYSSIINCGGGRKCCFQSGEDTTCLAIGGECIEDFQRCKHGSIVSAACSQGKHCCSTYYLGILTNHCQNVPVISRQSWGARKSVRDRPLKPGMPYFIMHNTAAKLRCNGLETCAKYLVDYQRLHMTDHGWDDIGYTFTIDDGGHIYETTGWGKRSVHSHDFNARSYAVSFMGTFTSEIPTTKALESLRGLAQCGMDNGWLARDYKYLGHRDVRPITLDDKDCPGFKFYTEMNTWKRFSHLALLPDWSDKDDKECYAKGGLCYDIKIYPTCINGTYHEKNDIKCTGHSQRKCCVKDEEGTDVDD